MGDYLFARAFSTLIHETMPDVVTIMADVTYELSQGELIQEQVVFQPDLAEADYFRLIELKTSALIGAACEIGGVVGGATSEEQMRLRGFGRKLGFVYQIVDDILDYAGEEALMGKPVHTDLAQGKVTLPLILAFELATESERRRTEALFEEGLSRREPADGQPGPELDGRPEIPWHEIEEIVKRHEGVSLARGRVAALAEDARSDLSGLATEGLADRLEPILDYVLSRDR